MNVDTIVIKHLVATPCSNTLSQHLVSTLCLNTLSQHFVANMSECLTDAQIDALVVASHCVELPGTSKEELQGGATYTYKEGTGLRFTDVAYQACIEFINFPVMHRVLRALVHKEKELFVATIAKLVVFDGCTNKALVCFSNQTDGVEASNSNIVSIDLDQFRTTCKTRSQTKSLCFNAQVLAGFALFSLVWAFGVVMVYRKKLKSIS